MGTSSTFEFISEIGFRGRVGLDGSSNSTQFGLQPSEFLDVEDEVEDEGHPPAEHGGLEVAAGGFGEEFEFGQDQEVVEEPVAEEAEADSQGQEDVGTVEAGGRVVQDVFGLDYGPKYSCF